jgi:ribosomal protein L25 (general stress protein Ctc)
MVIELKAEHRTDFGKEKCAKLRVANKLPGNIYGGPLSEPQAINLDLHETEMLVKANGKSAQYAVVLDDNTYAVRIQEIRYEPLYKKFQHVDFVVEDDDG